MSDTDDLMPIRLELVANGRPTTWWARAVFATTYERDKAYSVIIRTFRASPVGVALQDAAIVRFKAASKTPTGRDYIELEGTLAGYFRTTCERHGVPIVTLEARPAEALS